MGRTGKEGARDKVGGEREGNARMEEGGKKCKEIVAGRNQIESYEEAERMKNKEPNDGEDEGHVYVV